MEEAKGNTMNWEAIFTNPIFTDPMTYIVWYLASLILAVPTFRPVLKNIKVPETGRGLGANFIVEWASSTAIHEPVVEAVMLTSLGTHGFSLISAGRVLEKSE